MLTMNKWFRVTVHIDDEEKLDKAILDFNIEVESERYTVSNEEFDWDKQGANRFILECNTSVETFDEFVEHLKQVFTDSWVKITY